MTCKEAGTAILLDFYIVDDDPSFGKSLKRMLSAMGYSADYFESAQSFFNSVSPDRHGCAVVDIHMPECDGFSLVDKMHDLHYDMPVVMVTGRCETDTRSIALQKGALGFLQKPFGQESLFELLGKTS